MSFRKYNGIDKYHFRIYKRGKSHPFIVAVVEEKEENGKILISGYMFTHSILRVIERPNDYIRITNPNPYDDAESYVCIQRINSLDSAFFSKPYTGWHLSKEDEKLIDGLEEKYLNK